MYLQKQGYLNTTFKLLEGMKVKLINEPQNFSERLSSIFPGLEFINKLQQLVDSIFLFVQSKDELVVELPILSKFVKNEGFLIISIPNRNMSFISDINDVTLNMLAKKFSMKLLEKSILDDAWDSYVYTHDGKVLL
ncbi:MAG: hypothetical protein Q8L04_05440 [Ignavibacteria bacterium]|nr:hypothetical protein [Ignavibacteria bacterium]